MDVRVFAKTFLTRSLIALLVVGAAAATFVWAPYFRARGIILSEIERREKNRQTRNELEKAIEGIASPSQLTPKKRGAIKSYADTVENVSSAIQAADLTPPPRLPQVRVTPVPALKSLVADVNGIISDPAFGTRYSRAEEILNEGDRLLSYHAAVMKALINVLEYDPEADFQSFDPESSDTKERIGRAKEGLDKTLDRLDAAAPLYDDSRLDGVKAEVTKLQGELNLLESGNDKNRWTRAVDLAQQRILVNRTAFWEEESESVVSNLKAVDKELVKILEEWRKIKRRFDL